MNIYILSQNNYHGGDPNKDVMVIYESQELAKEHIKIMFEENPPLEEYGEWITDGWQGGNNISIKYTMSKGRGESYRYSIEEYEPLNEVAGARYF